MTDPLDLTPDARPDLKQMVRYLVTDEHLRQRCEDLLLAGAHYDRVVREACVVLEDRVRVLSNSARTLIGTSLMEQVFGGTTPRLRLSDIGPEQVGGMDLYRGLMAFFRNVAGHHLVETYTERDAIRLVAWVDLLLTMAERARGRQERPPTEVRFFDAIVDRNLQEATRSFLQEVRRQGLAVIWGTLGLSLYASFGGGAIAVAWLFPPGRSGWMGLTDLTLGYDPASMGFNERTSPVLKGYVSMVSAIGDRPQRVQRAGLEAYAFSFGDLARFEPELNEALAWVARHLRETVQ